MSQLPRPFFARPALVVARDLLGRHLVRDDVVLRITETEAYTGPDDTACHARMGPTRRNAAMFDPPGHAYVYTCYGIHQLLNLVTDTQGHGAAVLIRAAEPVAGLDIVRSRRGGKEGPVLLTGPGKVGAALDLDPSWSHHDLCAPGGLEVHAGTPVENHLAGPRVGIDYAAEAHRDAPWRFAVAGTRWVTRRSSLSRAADSRGTAPRRGSPGCAPR